MVWLKACCAATAVSHSGDTHRPEHTHQMATAQPPVTTYHPVSTFHRRCSDADKRGLSAVHMKDSGSYVTVEAPY